MSDPVHDLVIVGAGAAGLMAAAEAARLGLHVRVLEGQKEAGLKILISGGGRCNVTNARVSEKDYAAGCAFTLRHVLGTTSPRDMADFFEAHGAPLVLQETGEFFSADDKARTVRDALVRAVTENGGRITCGRRVNAIVTQDGSFNVVGHDFVVPARAVIIATGGLSYPATGSDGAGYRLAQAFGHNIVATHPALVPLTASDDTFGKISGITIPVRLSLWAEGRKLRSIDGPLLFTHEGFSGPAPMEMSGYWLAARQKHGCAVHADFLPAFKPDDTEFLLRPALAARSVKNILTGFLPERLVGVLLGAAGVDSQRPAGQLTRDQRKAIVSALRAFPLPLQDTSGYARAEVTSGGVDLKELKGATLASRLQEGLYFAGEVLDVDGRIGGFNLHWAWASGLAAARAVARNKKGKA